MNKSKQKRIHKALQHRAEKIEALKAKAPPRMKPLNLACKVYVQSCIEYYRELLMMEALEKLQTQTESPAQ